jgi:hypothetical protein
MSEYRRDDRAHRSVGAGAMAYGAAMSEPAPDAAAVNGPVRQLRVPPLAGAAPAHPAWRARTTSRPTPSTHNARWNAIAQPSPSCVMRPPLRISTRTAASNRMRSTASHSGLGSRNMLPRRVTGAATGQIQAELRGTYLPESLRGRALRRTADHDLGSGLVSSAPRNKPGQRDPAIFSRASAAPPGSRTSDPSAD